MTLTAGIAVVLTSSVLFPLFQTSAWFFAGIGAVITVGAAGLLSRRRTLPPLLCFIIVLVALLLYLNLIFEARHSWAAVLPTPGSLSGLWRVMRDGFDESRRYAPPAPGQAGLNLLATTGIGITAVMTDLIAVRMRSVALAGLPLLVLFTVPSTFNASRSPLATGIIFCLATIGYLSMLSADGRERIRIWGRLVSLWRTHEGAPRDAVAAPSAVASPGPGPAAVGARSRYQVLRGPDTRALAAAGRRVGFASILLALCAPLLVPGLHAAHLSSTSWTFGGGSGSGSIQMPDPLNQTGTQLQDTHPRTLFTYTTTDPGALRSNPQYLHQYVMTLFGDGWHIGAGGALNTQSFDTQLPAQAPGITNAGAEKVTTTITFPSGGQQADNVAAFLPVPYPPVAVYDLNSGWQDDPETLMVVSARGSTAGMSYQVVSHYVNPSKDTMRSLTPPPSMAKYTDLPSGFAQSAKLQRLLGRIIAGQSTMLDRVEAVKAWLDSGQYNYSLFAPAINSPDSLLQFLTVGKSGDCVQFAEAMTILLRMAKIPARLAVGYTQGNETAPGSGHWVVKSSDAHAWPEVFFPGYGWIRFEPVAQSDQGTATQPAFDSQLPGPATAPTTPISIGNQNGSGTNLGKPSGTLNGHRLGQEDGGAQGQLIGAAKKHAGTPWTAIALAVLAALALAGGIMAMVAPAGRRMLAARPGPLTDRARLNVGAVVVASLAGAGIVALALYRMLSRTHGLALGTGWATVGIAFGATCAAILAVPTACRALLRRWRWLRAKNDEAKAHAAWLELCADLADYGIGHLPSESPRAVAGRVRTGLALAEPAAAAVARIALAEEHVSYAGRPPASAGTLHRDGTAARRGIARASGPPARWRARIFPSSIFTALTDLAAHVPDTWHRLTTRHTP